MKHYATLLDIEVVTDSRLEKEDLFFPRLQEEISYRMLWGYGVTKEESMLNAMKNLERQGILDTFECLGGAHTIVKNNDGKEALRHLWLHYSEDQREPALFPVPGHDALVGFCNRYRLPEEAKQELTGFFTAFLHRDNQHQPVLQEDSMNTDTPNSHGLFDAPVRSEEKERVTLTEADIERQLDAGAFFMDPTAAIESGFIDPNNEPDTVIIDVRREDV